MIDKDKLYDWQKEAFQKWTENALKGIAVAPTGVGKTTYALFCMQTIRKKTIIIVPTIILMKQWKEEFLIKIKDEFNSNDLVKFIETTKYKVVGLPFYNQLDENNFCKLHNTPQQPKLCKYPNKDDMGEGFVYLTKRCVYDNN